VSPKLSIPARNWQDVGSLVDVFREYASLTKSKGSIMGLRGTIYLGFALCAFANSGFPRELVPGTYSLTFDWPHHPRYIWVVFYVYTNNYIQPDNVGWCVNGAGNWCESYAPGIVKVTRSGVVRIFYPEHTIHRDGSDLPQRIQMVANFRGRIAKDGKSLRGFLSYSALDKFVARKKPDSIFRVTVPLVWRYGPDPTP